jgi:hypothetical protein
MSIRSPSYLNPQAQAEALTAFIAEHAKSYDLATDTYERPPFASDIKEGKNDPIYNAHSYHTKVPPRSIVPYILHYTEPGDLVLDLFCGSGMTGVAAQMCAQPPADILDSFPDLKDRIGTRACILNDLSPAACHIAYNYNTPVDVESLKREYARIKAVVKDEFAWLYGTEHYEPAVGLYDPKNAEVAARLKNPPSTRATHTLLGSEERTWELLTKAEVEDRLGYSVADLPPDDDWSDITVNKVKQWICIPATIQYTVWSDVYRCEGFVTIEEPTGKVSTRGKNAGKPILAKKRVARGCGHEISLWKATNEIDEGFTCPHCNQLWTTDQATLLRTEPSLIILSFAGLISHRNHESQPGMVVRRRPSSQIDKKRVEAIESQEIPYWFPQTELVPGEEGNRLINNDIKTVDAVYTKRNLRALAALWSSIAKVSPERLQAVLRFLFTSVSVGLCSKLTRYNFGKRGNGSMAARLFLPHFQCESNVMKVIDGKFDDLAKYFSNVSPSAACAVLTLPAQSIHPLPDSSIDFIFTDPPFGRNIAYSELNILWEAWLGAATKVNDEAITSNARKWANEGYNKKMAAAFVEMFRVLKPGRYAMIEFNNRDPELFEGIKAAATDAGFVIRNMLLLDKDQKTFKQVQGILRGEGTLDKDVIFNIAKPSSGPVVASVDATDLDQQVADAVRQHLQSLPDRIKAEPAKYNEEHRTSATINSMLMNALIPRGVSVERLSLPFIERVCARYFRRIGQRWYLRGESVGGGYEQRLIAEEVNVTDEVSAIAWLRQKVQQRPMLVGELNSLWMRATGLLPPALSQELVLEDLLSENFWRDPDTNRWREPTEEEREKMNDDRSIRVLHDAERYVAGTLHRATSDFDRCEWIDVLFKACRQVEDGDMQSLPALRGFNADEGYRLIARLFQSVLREKVPVDVFSRAQKQAGAASNRISQGIRNEDELRNTQAVKSKGPTLFDEVN